MFLPLNHIASSSPLIGSLTLWAAGPLHLLLQTAALLLQLQQRVGRVLLLADQDELLQQRLLLPQQLHEVAVAVGLGPPGPALAVQLRQLVLDDLHPAATGTERQRNVAVWHAAEVISVQITNWTMVPRWVGWLLVFQVFREVLSHNVEVIHTAATGHLVTIHNK